MLLLLFLSCFYFLFICVKKNTNFRKGNLCVIVWRFFRLLLFVCCVYNPTGVVCVCVYISPTGTYFVTYFTEPHLDGHTSTTWFSVFGLFAVFYLSVMIFILLLFEGGFVGYFCFAENFLKMFY